MEFLHMKGISKTYPGTKALDNVDFSMNKGEIVSLLGENGAGKTTLMKVLYGLVKPDGGEIYLRGKPVQIRKPIDAIRLGVCMVHQHFMLVPAFTVWENIVVGDEPGGGVLLDKAKARKKAKELIDAFHFQIDPDAKVSGLSVGEQQRVEILKALYREAELLILDEPTAVLTPHEVDDLFVILEELRKNGKSIVIITHKLKETMAIADRITVLRDGRIIRSDIKPSETEPHALSEMMVGRRVELGVTRRSETMGEVCFTVENLSLHKGGKDFLQDINFSIRTGEILGVAGIEGNGQTQLLECLTGLSQPDSMTVTMDGKKVTGDAKQRIRSGIAHVPEDRGTMGCVAEMDIASNLILGYHRGGQFCTKGILKNRQIRDYAIDKKERFGIKAPSVDTLVHSLSGGNQQKVIIARTFSQDPRVLIIAQPTRGVDVGAMDYIHNRMLDLRDEGKAILLVSADLDEIRALSDRIVVLYEGRLVAECAPERYSETQLGLLMTGSKTVAELEGEAQ